ncbi:hypothetical protein [Flavisolibacter nicotianae]|uniref:hypothetical protein n=1 Tax=Flavisolibacter nicotianae TaxID=2364882 RepID=UPI001F08F669|nr:hypothetical protein [Flavisolibacter nicotianae]
MTLYRLIPVLCLFLLSVLNSEAQKPVNGPTRSNLRIKRISLTVDTLALDSLSIVPGTFSVNVADTGDYRLDFVNAVLYWKRKPAVDSASVIYRVFPQRLNAVVQRRSFDSISRNFTLQPFEFNKGEASESKGLFDFGNVQYNGSFGRQLSFGNNQDAVVNSNFQLQLNGMLRDSIEISAALSDNNLPIQPDGTTQQLNEFDQVFLQFKKRGWQLSLGDIDIRQNSLYFLNFYKRLQGISFQTVNRLSPSVQSTTLVSGSIAKGKFNRNVFQGQEGNQGPYRLAGANNEFFFIVLGNTERVFLDGELLQRGEDQDYIINYNTAEITFMPRRMITKDSRIQVEFEYADRNFLNANLFANQELAINDKLRIRVGAFQNSDAKNSTINQSLDARQKQFLFDLGDSIQRALYPTAIPDTFAAGKILYQKLYDTAGGVVVDSFYRYSVNPDSARYSLSFTDLGQGGGNYVPDFNGANGKVYRYVAPLNGIRQGRFEPVAILVTPKKQQVISIGTDFQINKNNLLKTELAISNYNVNTFSAKDKGNDQGIAARVQYNNTIDLSTAKKQQLVSTFDYEHVQDGFKPVERLRVVEFSREWGLPLLLSAATEDILRLSTSLKNTGGALTYQFMNYQRSDRYKGYQNMLQHSYNANGWAINNQVALTTFRTSASNGSFFRPVIDMSRVFKKLSALRLGFRYALEKNEVRQTSKDTLSPVSFSFDTYTAYLRSDESKRNKWGLSFFTRSDKYPTATALVRGDRSYNTSLQIELLQSTKHQLLFNTTYRVLKVYDKSVSNQNDDKTILGRTEYIVNEWKGLLTGNVLYELGTGQEQRRDFAYLEVPAGQGEYTWIDANNDSIQQLNEFELARFQDQAKYIRVFTPTNQFTKANYTTFNYSINLNPKAVFNEKEKRKLAAFVSRLSLQSSLQKSKKSIANGDFEFNPFKYSIQDTALLTNSTALLNAISFNRFSSKWGIDISNLRNSGKALLTYGYETRQTIDWTGKLRWNISSSLTFDVNGKRGTNALYTPSFGNRNYELAVQTVEPRLAWIQGTIFRVQSSYRQESKKNKPAYGGETSLSNAVILDTKYNVLQNSSINAKFTYNNIRYDVPAATKKNLSVEYIMLDALRPGSNYLWSLDFTKRLLNNVEINLQYEGRKPAETRTIHVGRAAIRALF